MPLSLSIPKKPLSHSFNPQILREYDIRGKVDVNLSETDAYFIGLSFGTMVKRQGGSLVCVGYDGRDSSPVYAAAVIKGLKEIGLNVENVGLGPSPMLYFAVKDRMADGGIMITGSHNPSDYNGFKMTLQNSPVFGDAVQEIGAIATEGDFDFADTEGKDREIDIKDIYVERLLKDFDPAKPVNVVWDCGNGASGEITRRLTAKLPGKHILLFDEIDGSFPNHHPDPTVDKNLADLIKAVKENKFDLGVAFDGDGDRIGAVDENGNILRCDTFITLYAKDVLEDNPGATIIGDVKCSQIMFNEIERLGGNPIIWKTGHSLIKSKMAETKAPLAGELSGHIFFADKYYGFDDGLYCAIRLMNIVSEADGPISSLLSHLPTIYNTPEIRFEVKEEEKFDIVEKVASSVKAKKAEDMDISDIDGVRVITPEGWWLLRASNTQNVLVTRAEANSEEALEKLKDMVKQEVKKLGYELSFTPE